MNVHHMEVEINGVKLLLIMALSTLITSCHVTIGGHDPYPIDPTGSIEIQKNHTYRTTNGVVTHSPDCDYGTCKE